MIPDRQSNNIPSHPKLRRSISNNDSGPKVAEYSVDTQRSINNGSGNKQSQNTKLQPKFRRSINTGNHLASTVAEYSVAPQTSTICYQYSRGYTVGVDKGRL